MISRTLFRIFYVFLHIRCISVLWNFSRLRIKLKNFSKQEHWDTNEKRFKRYQQREKCDKTTDYRLLQRFSHFDVRLLEAVKSCRVFFHAFLFFQISSNSALRLVLGNITYVDSIKNGVKLLNNYCLIDFHNLVMRCQDHHPKQLPLCTYRAFHSTTHFRNEQGAQEQWKKLI